jgi:hypothetical protein
METERYPVETLDADDDDGTMEQNVSVLADAVVGHRIVRVERDVEVPGPYGCGSMGTAIVLDNGKRVTLAPGSDCCAYTELESFLLHPERVEHVITGVGTTDGYTTWHIYADMGDVLELNVAWSCGNPFYYAYGFTIGVNEE